MSYSVDAKLLLYAANSSAPEHVPALTFLQACAARTELFCISWPTIFAFLRISTHPSIFPAPLTFNQARRNVEALFSLPHVRIIGEADSFWQTFAELGDDAQLRGNQVPDAHFAAILKNNEVRTLFTNDAGFRRFGFLRVINPLATP